VLAILPPAPFQTIVSATEAEIIKYAGNCFLATKVIFMNMLYDYTAGYGGDWEHIREAVVADERIGTSHMTPFHQSGRGAGGHCFIKDFEAWLQSYAAMVGDKKGIAALAALRDKNVDLLTMSGKDIDLLMGVYGEKVVKEM
jgi:UDPglucose 6-dehydrogenase